MTKATKRSYTFVIFALLLILAWAIYYSLSAVSVQEGDGGELAAAAVTGAVVHPPGYPLYMIFARTAVSIFPDNPYLTLARMSALLEGLAGALLFLVGVRVTGCFKLASAVSLAWIIYEPTMRLSADAEVFALHHCFVLLLLLAVMRLKDVSLNKAYLWSFIVGFISGLGGAHHHTIILWAPLVIAVLAHHGFREKSLALFVKISLVSIVGALLGLWPYLTLIDTVSAPKDMMAFGPITDLTGMVKHMLRMAYGTFSMHLGDNPLDVSYLPYFLAFTALTAPLIVFGYLAVIVRAGRSRDALSIGAAGAALLHLWFCANIVMPYFDGLLQEFAMRFYGMLGLAGATLLLFAFRGISLSPVLKNSLLAGVVLPGLIQFPSALDGANAGRDLTGEHEQQSLLEELPKNSIFVSSSDRVSMGFYYKQVVEGKRLDVVHVVGPMMGFSAYRNIVGDRYPFLREIDLSGPVKFKSILELAEQRGMRVFTLIDHFVPKGYKKRFLGIAWEVVRKDAPELADGVLTERFLSFCQRWPDGLTDLSPHRRQSNNIVGREFFRPFKEHALTLPEDNPIRKRMLQAFESMLVGDSTQARQLCQQ